MINDVSAPSGVSLNDIMVIRDSVYTVFLLGPHRLIIIYHNYEFSSKHANFI